MINKWSRKEENILKKFWSSMPREELEKMLPDRTWAALDKKAGRINIHREKFAPDYNKKQKIDVEILGDYIVNHIKTAKPLIEIPYRKIFKGKQQETAVLLLSDIHIGKKNKFLDIVTGKSEITYDTDVMIQEFRNLTESIYSIIKLLSTSFNIEHLYIFALGDLVDNDRIFPGQRFSIDFEVGKQLWVGVQVISDFLRTMLSVFKHITFVNIIGNHGRFSAAREEAPVTNFFDYHLARILEVLFHNEKRISFIIPDSWFYLLTIDRWKYLLHHGDTVYSWLSIPFYGLTRQGKARRIELPYDLEAVGHFHQRMEIPVSSNSYTLVNGGFIPKDNYAWKKFGVISKPEQTFFGVSRKRPRTWSFALSL